MTLDPAQLLWDDLSPTEQQLVPRVKWALQGVSRGRPLTAAELGRHLGLSDPRPARRAIQYLRLAPSTDGMPCSLNGVGYWWSDTPEDIADTYRHLLSRKKALDAVCRGIEQKYNLIAQLRMEL